MIIHSPDNSKLKILIMYASYGNGHYQASKAIEASFHKRGLKEITLLDLMAEAHPFLNEMTKFVYMQSFKTIPAFYGWVYNATKELPPTASLLTALHSLGQSKLEQTILQIQPDVIIHTFPQLAMIKLLKKLKLSIPLINIITDFDLHGRWIHPEVDQYYVATEDLKSELIQRGISADKIMASGIPLMPDFADKSFYHQKQQHSFSLDPQRKTVLLMAGAFGVMQGIKELSYRLVSSEAYQIITVCGNNKELFRRLKHDFAGHNYYHLIGYTNEISSLMKRSDCIITKPGGITLSESIASRLPIFIYRPVPGQELNNALYLENKGIAHIAYDTESLVGQIDDLFRDKQRLETTYRIIDQLRRPDAADTIVNDILTRWLSPNGVHNSITIPLTERDPNTVFLKQTTTIPFLFKC